MINNIIVRDLHIGLIKKLNIIITHVVIRLNQRLFAL